MVFQEKRLLISSLAFDKISICQIYFTIINTIDSDISANNLTHIIIRTIVFFNYNYLNSGIIDNNLISSN